MSSSTPSSPSRLAPAVLAPGIAVSLRLLARTWRVRCDPCELDRLRGGGPAVLAFFHGHMVPVVALHAYRGFVGMASRSPDGEILARVIRQLGYGVVRGSGSRSAIEATRAALRVLREEGSSFGLAVDGPRGPRFQPHPGAAALAGLAKCPLVWAVARVRGGLEMSSWDRTVVPLPGARVEIRYGRLPPPPKGRKHVRETTRRLGRAMRDACR